MAKVITIEEQIKAQEVLNRMYKTYQTHGDFVLMPGIYEAIYPFLKEFLGSETLLEIYQRTNGSKDNTRKAQIKHLFDHVFTKKQEGQP